GNPEIAPHIPPSPSSQQLVSLSIRHSQPSTPFSQDVFRSTRTSVLLPAVLPRRLLPAVFLAPSRLPQGFIVIIHSQVSLHRCSPQTSFARLGARTIPSILLPAVFLAPSRLPQVSQHRCSPQTSFARLVARTIPSILFPAVFLVTRSPAGEGRRKRGVGARRLEGNRIDEQRTRNVDAEMSGVDVKQSYNQRGPA
ncbi:hypothetical protein LINPERHAP2_LOCUS37516, partial [Linum perenne]